MDTRLQVLGMIEMLKAHNVNGYFISDEQALIAISLIQEQNIDYICITSLANQNYMYYLI